LLLIITLARIEFPDTATNGLALVVRDGNAVVALKDFNDALDLRFLTVGILLASHCRDCLVKMLDFSVCFPFRRWLHATNPWCQPRTCPNRDAMEEAPS
jgi:hypothetical protein